AQIAPYLGGYLGVQLQNALVDSSWFSFQSRLSSSKPQLVFSIDNAPTNLSLTKTTIAENSPANSSVGTFSTTDSDIGDTFTYSLVSGNGSTDNSSFTVAGNQLRTAASFDYESKSSYSIRVRATDSGGLTFEKSFTISVTDVNEPPTAVALQNAVTSLPENTSTASRVKVADFAVTDDALGTNVLSLTGADASAFEIFSGGLYVRAGTVLDFETKNSYAVTVNVDDASVGG